MTDWDYDPAYWGTRIEVEYRGERCAMTYEAFVDANCKQFGRYEMLHRYALVHETDTLFMEGLLVKPDPEPQTLEMENTLGNLGFTMIRVVDLLWARARLEGLPNGGDETLADHSSALEDSA